MKPETYLILIIAALLVVTPVFHLTTVVDVALVPRFLCLSIVLILGIFLFSRKITQTTVNTLSWFGTCFLIWYLVSAISLLWAFNIAEGIFTVQRIFLALVVYLLLRFLLSEYGSKATRIMLICNVVVTLLIMGNIFWEMNQSPTIFSLAYKEFTDIKGFSAQRNLLCSFLFLTLIFNTLFVGQIKQQPWRIAYFGLIALQIFILLLFQTRAVYVALATFGFFFVIGFQRITSFFNTKKAIMFAGILAILIGLVWARYYLYDDDFDVYLKNIDVRKYFGSSSANQRFKIWELTMLLIREQPLTGVGAGNWEIFFPKNGITELFDADIDIFFQRPHNDFLWVFSEGGLFGFLAYIGMFFSAFFIGFKSLKNADKNTQLNIWTLLCGLLGYIIIANLSFPLERIEHQIWLMLLFSMLFFYAKNVDKYSFQLPLKIDTRVLLLLALAGLSFNLVLGYHRCSSEKAMRIVYNNNTPNAEKKQSLAQAKSPFFTIDHVGFPLSWYAGIIANNEGDYLQAQAHFAEAYQANPYNYKVLTDLASTNGQLKNYDAAKKYLLEAYNINNHNQGIIFNLSVLHYNLKDRQEAIKWANKLSETYPRKQELMRQLGISN